MNKIQSNTSARMSKQSLTVLLLACTGALLVIIITMTNSQYDMRSAQSPQTSSANDTSCGMLAYLRIIGQPAAVSDDCQAQSGPELR